MMMMKMIWVCLLLSWIGLADMVRVALISYSAIPIRLAIETILADGHWLIDNHDNRTD